MSSREAPRRGEVWLVDLNPTVGDEMNKTRRVVVVSSDYAGALRIKTAVPFTAATPAKKGKFWLVPIAPSALNGLTKDTVADVLQVRGLSTDRFARRLGSLSETDMAEICAALALAIELDV